MAKTNITYREILDRVRKQEYAPIYLLAGPEPYYIDLVSDFIADNVLPPEERDFNLTVVYCTRETELETIVNSARRYPMMAKRQVVIVKEAQNLLKFDDLVVYAQNPMPSTILVICYKKDKVDHRKKFVAMVEKTGVLFESAKLKDGMLPQFITEYVRQKQLTIEDRACMVMAESVGTNLSRLSTELDKLAASLPQGESHITSALVERVVGVSKEFSVWELRAAVANKNWVQATRIHHGMKQDAKNYAPVMIVAVLFNFFSLVMQSYYPPNLSEADLMKHLDLYQNWQLREFLTARRNYPGIKVMRIIGKLREADARLKGIGKGNMTDDEIMNELLYYIFH